MTGTCSRVLLRLDAGHAVGLGHAVRARALLEALGRPLDLVVAGRGEALAAQFPAARHVPCGAGGDADLADLVARESPDLVLVDLPHLPESGWRALRGAGRPVAAVDDEGGAVVADLVINGTVLDRYHHYPALPPGARLLCGADYTLLRPAFGQTAWEAGAARGVVAVAGGGAWADLLAGPTLDRAGGGPVRLVVGPACPGVEALAARAARHGVVLRQGLSPSALAGALARARVALVTGGMVLYEAMAVGVPAVVFPQMPNLPPEADWFAARGAVRTLGDEGGMDEARLAAEVTALLGDEAAARAQSRAARALVDGRGLARAALALGTLLTEATR